MTAHDPTAIGASASLLDIETFETVADWRADLSARIARAKLRHELAGLSPEATIELAAEAHDFQRVCLALRGVFDA